MRSTKWSAALVCFVVFAAGASLATQSTSTNRNSSEHYTLLGGNTRPEAIHQNDRGSVSDDFLVRHAQLLLRRPAAREAKLDAFLADLHAPGNPSYHAWLSADQFGKRFGPSDADIAPVVAWLRSSGLSVEAVSRSRMRIGFSGKAAAVERAFHTQLHYFAVNGVRHFANTSDPAVPTRLAATVAGVFALHDFPPHKDVIPLSHPDLTGCGSHGVCLALVPADLATIYNIKKVFLGGITGKGVTIVVVEDSDVGNIDTGKVSNADWYTFRNKLGLSGYKFGRISQIHPQPAGGGTNCSDPGVNADENEADLDIQWASASAPDANVVLASCADIVGFGGLVALQNLLDDAAPPPIVSMSYGECEVVNGAAANAAFNETYKQAVAEGTTVVVSSGDEGAVACDAGEYVAHRGISVSGYTSSPYDVSVGGTDFGDTYSLCRGKSATFPACDAKYWNSTNNAVYGSAKSYIPEIPCNNSCAGKLISIFETGSALTYGTKGFCNSTLGENFETVVSGSGGPSSCARGLAARFGVSSGTCAGWPKPVWQAHAAGNPSDGVRDIPDVSLFASNGYWGHFYLFCDSNKIFFNGGSGCSPKFPHLWAGAGGTSFAAPIFAGILALVEQKTRSRQGNANIALYGLASKQNVAGSHCDSSLGTNADSRCVFYDVTQGDIDVDCRNAHDCFRPSGQYGVLSTNNKRYAPAFGTTKHWDFATGLGSVNVANLVNHWPA